MSTAFTILLSGVMLAGIGLLLYPTVSDLWNSYHQTKAIITYAKDVSDAGEETCAALWDAAEAYNARLAGKESRSSELSEEERADYERQLSITENSPMGFVEIPDIRVSLPIYHGTSEGVLQKAIGHIEGSSLPIGGKSTHAVISGHRGLPSARLFTDLDKLEEGDLFFLHVLGKTLTYEVDQILTVEPDELEALEIVPGQDYCTLVTCTPYGINSHRLLVRGNRTEVSVQEAEEEQDPEQEPEKDYMIFAVMAVLGIFLVLAVLLAVWKKKRKKRRRKQGKEKEEYQADRQKKRR